MSHLPHRISPYSVLTNVLLLCHDQKYLCWSFSQFCTQLWSMTFQILQAQSTFVSKSCMFCRWYLCLFLLYLNFGCSQGSWSLPSWPARTTGHKDIWLFSYLRCLHRWAVPSRPSETSGPKTCKWNTYILHFFLIATVMLGSSIHRPARNPNSAITCIRIWCAPTSFYC